MSLDNMSIKNNQFECEFCKNIFSSSSSLENHKKTAKFCLKIQHKESTEFYCKFCNKVLSTKSRLTTHLDVCKLKRIETPEEKLLKDQNEQLRQQIKEKDMIIREKDQIIKDLAEKAISNAKPTINNNNTNNTINNLQVMSDDHIRDQAKNLTIDHIKRGALGYSEYFLEYPLKERVACTDYARRKLKYKNENGEIVTDPEMTNLAERLFQSIKDRNKELTIQYTRELTDKYKDEKGAIEISHFMDLATKFSEQDLEVFKMFNGDKNDFFHDILRHICSKTLV